MCLSLHRLWNNTLFPLSLFPPVLYVKCELLYLHESYIHNHATGTNFLYIWPLSLSRKSLPTFLFLRLCYIPQIALQNFYLHASVTPKLLHALICRLRVHAGCQRIHADYQRVHAGCQWGCPQFSPTSWCGLGPSVPTVLVITGERLCQNTTSAFWFCLYSIISLLYISWIAPARQQWSTFC